MSPMAPRSKSQKSRRLRNDYAAWDKQQDSALETALRFGLVVIDTNVLLRLYEIEAKARNQIFRALKAVGDRVWIPDQVATEFASNRRRVTINAVSRFKQARDSIEAASRESINTLHGAVKEVENLRKRNRTTRPWSPKDVGLDKLAISSIIDNVKRAALEEIGRLQEEQDISVEDLDSHDVVLDSIDELFASRIGEPLEGAKIRELVEEANNFRYPNKIPPGYGDENKPTNLARAGDYILWWETIQHARDSVGLTGVLIVTSDVKADWWCESRRPPQPRPELIHEMAREAGHQLSLATLVDFLAASKKYLSTDISEETLTEVREVEASAALSATEHSTADALPYIELSNLSESDLYDLVVKLFQKMGYATSMSTSAGEVESDLFLAGKSPPFKTNTLVEIRRNVAPISVETMRVLAARMARAHVARGMIVSTGGFTRAARQLASELKITPIDGVNLSVLLRIHLGLNIGVSIDGPDAGEGS